MASGAGFMVDAISTVKRNRTFANNRRAKYAKLREQYIGVGNKNNSEYKSHLTPAQIAEGRKRAKAYYSKRNRRINATIAISIVGGFVIAAVVINKYLLH